MFLILILNAAIAAGSPVQSGRIMKGLELAGRILQKASAKAEDPMDAELYDQMFNRLFEVIIIPEDPNNPVCRDKVMGATYPSSNIIYICQQFFRTREFKTPDLAQVIIHEAAHKIGIRDECEATRIEVAIMRQSKIGLQFENGYWQRCNQR